jgi:hypothetical protein
MKAILFATIFLLLIGCKDGTPVNSSHILGQANKDWHSLVVSSKRHDERYWMNTGHATEFVPEKCMVYVFGVDAEYNTVGKWITVSVDVYNSLRLGQCVVFKGPDKGRTFNYIRG